MSELSIRTLAENAVQQLQKIGLSTATISFYQEESFNLIIRFFEERGITNYTSRVMNEYLAFEQSRFLKGEIGLNGFMPWNLEQNDLCVLLMDKSLNGGQRSEAHKSRFHQCIKPY